MTKALAMGKRIDIDWTAVGLGDVGDEDLAEQLGCSPNTVAARRRRAGIPPFRRHRRVLPLGRGSVATCLDCVHCRTCKGRHCCANGYFGFSAPPDFEQAVLCDDFERDNTP